MKNCRSFFARALALGPALAVLLCLLSSGTALGQDFAAAGRHFAAAQDAFAQGRFPEAAREYQAAYDITQDPALLFNVGESFQRAGDNKKAIIGYKSYLQAQPGASDRKEVEKRLQELEAATPGTPPAEQETARPAPPAKSASTEGGLLTVAPKTTAVGPLRTAAWTTVAGAVAFLTAGAVLGLAAQSRADEIHRRATLIGAGQIPPVYDDSQRSAYESLLSDGRSYNNAAIATFTVAGAAAVVATVLFIVDNQRQRCLLQRQRVSARVLSLSPVPRFPLSAAWSF